ncbi:glutathione S-transferase [Rhodoblastus acidophilus]|uniref:glutathione S-transferase family protein n=1 Tax=Rhodoblastus acidophilus TaxID=1074 RepID=UPI00222507D0|nr:glutathione S-transferase [Rhodoblastus acidophilus]MCW2316078.1 glutathione S-transferase [Rhodoblastus acidophilus]
MLTVHHLNNSRSQRVLWLLEELGVPYEIKHYQRDARTMLAPPELLAVHPLGKSPVITDDGVTVAETGAIVEYSLARYGEGRLAPSDAIDRLRYTYWLHFAEGSAMPPLVMTLLFGETVKRAPVLVRPIARAIANTVRTSYLEPQIQRQLDLMESELARGGWFAGSEISGADVMMSFPVEAAAQRVGLGDRLKLKGWLQTIHARPAYRRALEKGGPYSFA